jgi:isopentenyl-diphosphate delta-isomerase
MSGGGITRRKADHIDLAATGDVGFERTTTLLECVKLVHQALPEIALADVDTSLTLFGKRLRAPLVIAAMTGGVDRALTINRELASLAEARGYAFGLGSQRAMHLDASKAETYRVRDAAPRALVLGNVGIVQARQMTTAEVRALVDDVGADALCVHLNPAMEIVQPGGDRDFAGGVATLARLVSELGVPVMVKETGCGLSLRAARQLREAGVRHVDVSGAGGTSWVAVEMHRAQGGDKVLGEAFREWGIPTAASVAWMASAGFETVIATGGISTGLEVAKAIALGASAAGIARPVLQALTSEGRAGAERFLDQVEAELRAAMLLVGAGSVAALRVSPRIIVGELTSWMTQGDAEAEIRDSLE